MIECDTQQAHARRARPLFYHKGSFPSNDAYLTGVRHIFARQVGLTDEKEHG